MEFIDKIMALLKEGGASQALAIAYIVVSALVVIMAIVALVMWIVVAIRYSRANRMQTSSGKTSCEVAREALDKAGLHYVQVKKASFLRAWFWGNSYSLSKKTIFLRRNIMEKSSLTAVGLALQKVGIAKAIEGGDIKAKTRNFLQIFGVFGPFMFIPLVLLGAIIDIVLFSHFGTWSIAGLVVGIIFLLTGALCTFLNIPVEKKANKVALELLEEHKVCTASEREEIKKVLDTYITAYILDFIVTVLRIIQLILEILINSRTSSN